MSKKLRGNPYTQADEIQRIIVAVITLLELIKSPEFTHGQKKGFAINIEYVLNKFEREFIENDSPDELPF